MAVQSNTTRTSNRVTSAYTVGDPSLRPDTSTVATAPFIGGSANVLTARTVSLVGTDVQPSPTIIVGALAAGASTTVVATIVFPNLPTPLTLGPNDLGEYIVDINAIIVGLPTLAISSFAVTPRAFNQLGGLYQGSALQPNATFTGWGAQVSVTLVAVAATAATTLVARASAKVYDTLG